MSFAGHILSWGVERLPQLGGKLMQLWLALSARHKEMVLQIWWVLNV